jgi:hypothetical protein
VSAGKGGVARKVGANRRGNAGKGRPKGSKNKTTVAIKTAILTAFEQRGGVSSLVKWAAENETEFYKLWGRLAPTEVEQSGEVVVRVLRDEAA